jgi:hypothetical protein
MEAATIRGGLSSRVTPEDTHLIWTQHCAREAQALENFGENPRFVAEKRDAADCSKNIRIFLF